MKIILKYIFVLLIIIFFSNCKDDGTSPVDLTKSYSVSGIVLDVVSSDYSPGVKKGAPIFIDKDSTISGVDGTFIFNKISEGNHTIRVTLPSYEPFSKSISVSKDTSILIYLYGLKSNYFPIEENSIKIYDYFSSYGGGYPGQDSGRATWTISTGKLVENSKVYDVFEKIIFTHKTFSPLYSERVDSFTTNFTISESNVNIISFKSAVLDGVSFNRNIDSRQEQNGVIEKSYNNPGSLISTVNISLKRDVGLTKIVQFGNGWGKTYKLIQ
ncbi:MAG: carboxypeptidase-like regulatory domain-containing protein [Melioribacteraceae bacterium]|nr:carboxypeptidase-like regulatory domain-containing protein [Melioribacteraceae bacterium]